MRLFHSRTQHSVGQGGFHTACVDDGEQVFRYAYDCGSMNRERLAECITSVAASIESLDVLFLSHLDLDHSNGVDRLLDVMPVHTVVLPYLSPWERLILAAEATASHHGLGSSVSATGMLSEPLRWFARRGVERVVFISGPSVRRSNDAQIEDSPGRGRLRMPGAVKPTDAEVSQFGPSEKSLDVRIAPSIAMELPLSSSEVWQLHPYVHPAKHNPAFRKAVAGILKLGNVPDEDPRWMRKLLSIIHDRDRRRELAQLYTTHLWRDRNLSSMTLYSGPATRVFRRRIGESGPGWICTHWSVNRAEADPDFNYRDHCFEGYDHGFRIGWIGTGDAHLDRATRMTAFATNYDASLPYVRTIVMPHHGSKHNLDSKFLHDNPNVTWVAAYGTNNSYGHPHQHFMDLAKLYGNGVLVTEDLRSEFFEQFALERDVPR